LRRLVCADQPLRAVGAAVTPPRWRIVTTVMIMVTRTTITES
jgi:hypothetical protein